MKSKYAIYNIISAAFLQIILVLVGIISPRVIISSYGSNINGLISSIKQFIGYINIVEAGLAGAAIYALYKPLSNKDYNEVNSILSACKKLYNQSGILFSIIVVILSFLFPYIIPTNNIEQSVTVSLVLILGFNGSLEFFSMGKYRSLLTADEKSYIISIIHAIIHILNCLIVVVMSRYSVNIVLLQIILSLSYILRSILFNVYIKKRYSFINFNVDVNTNVLKQRWDVMSHQITYFLTAGTPVSLITMFCSLAEVSVYSVYSLVINGISTINNIFNNACIASFGKVIANNNKDNIKSIYNNYEVIYYAFMTCIFSCTYILIMPFMSIYTKNMTDTNYLRADLALFMIIASIIPCIRNPHKTIVEASGHYKETKKHAIIEASIQVVISLICVIKFGMLGVVCGSICSSLYRTMVYILYASKEILNISFTKSIKRILMYLVNIFFIVSSITYLFDMQVNNMVDWLILGTLCMTYSTILVIIQIIIFERETLKYIMLKINILKKYFKRKAYN